MIIYVLNDRGHPVAPGFPGALPLVPVKIVSTLVCNFRESSTRCSTRDLENDFTTGPLPVPDVLGTFAYTGEDGCCCCTGVTLRDPLRDKSASPSSSSDGSSGRCASEEVLASNLVFRPPACQPLNLTICVCRKSNHCSIH